MMTGEITALPVLIGELATGEAIEADLITEMHMTAEISGVEKVAGELSLPSFREAESEVF